MGRWVDTGENWTASLIANQSLGIGLYTNAVELPETATLSDIQEPPSGYGYARISLDSSQWTVKESMAYYPKQRFTASGGSWGTIYGYFIYSGSTLLGVQPFPEAVTVDDGDNVDIVPKLRVE